MPTRADAATQPLASSESAVGLLPASLVMPLTSFVACDENGPARAVWPAPPRIGADGRGSARARGSIRAVGLAGVQLQVTFLPAYGVGALAGWMFWLTWNTLSGS